MPPGAQQTGPAAQRGPGVGQRPQDMADQDDIEPPLPHGGFGGVPDQERRVPPGELGAGPLDHAG